jgi:phosphoribosyl-dephospho-CoA transferase
MPPRIHDLLEIDGPRFLRDQLSVPQWVMESLQRFPFVVVRRGDVTEHEIPVGVRGVRRNERWATSCHPSLVRRILTPGELLGRAKIPDRMPALRALQLLKERWRRDWSRGSGDVPGGDWSRSDVPGGDWGPGGSVGFELATGAPVVTPDSDLDAVIYAAQPFETSEARSLLEATRDLPAAVDVRVETPHAGFSLREYASREGATLLIRTPAGALLATDPWRVPSGDVTAAPV